MADLEQQKIEAFIHRWESSGAAERASTTRHSFLNCAILLAPPDLSLQNQTTRRIYTSLSTPLSLTMGWVIPRLSS